MNEAMRDWVTNMMTFYIIGTVAGPHPYVGEDFRV